MAIKSILKILKTSNDKHDIFFKIYMNDREDISSKHALTDLFYLF